MRNWNMVNGKLLVRRTEAAAQTAAGLEIPEQARKKPTTGVVVNSHATYRDPVTLRTLDFCIGQTILFSQFAGIEIEVDGENLLSLGADEVIAVLEEGT